MQVTKLRVLRIAGMSIVLFFSLVGNAQEQSATEPEFSDVFFRLDAGKLVALERQTATIQMSMKSASEFPGAKSPVRFAAHTPLEFVVRSVFASSMVEQFTLRPRSSTQRKQHAFRSQSGDCNE